MGSQGRSRTESVACRRSLLVSIAPNPTAVSPMSPEHVASSTPIRAFCYDVIGDLEARERVIDVLSPEEFSGELMNMPDCPQEGSLRGGHTPERRTTTALSRVATNSKRPSTKRTSVSRRATTSSPTAGSGSDRATHGSLSITCSVSKRFATTTGPGPGGATWLGTRSSAGSLGSLLLRCRICRGWLIRSTS